MTKRTIALVLVLLTLMLPVMTVLSGCSAGKEEPAAAPSASDVVSATEPTCAETDEGHDFGDWMIDPVEPSMDTLCHICSVCGKRELRSAWVPTSELPGHTISAETLALAAQMPEAKYNSLPDWNGVSFGGMGDVTDTDPRAWVINEATLDNVKALGFNYCRFGIDAKVFFKDYTMQEANYSMFMNLDRMFTELIERGIHVSFNYNLDFGVDNLLNQHTTLFDEPELQDAMLNFWTFMAERYKDVPSNFLDFDLLNEPWAYKSIDQYVDLMTEAISRIRAISPDRLITVEMTNWAHDPVPELAELQAIQAFHYYIPNSNENSETFWSPESVMARMKKYADFSEKYDTAIVVNEFGAHMDAPSEEAAAWFDASLDAFDAYNIQWCLTDYGYFYGFSGCDLTGTRKDTPYSVLFENGYITYIYPDILEPFQEHMGDAEITLKADDLRKNLYNDPRMLIMAPRVHLFDGDGHSFTSADWASHNVIENPTVGSSYHIPMIYEYNKAEAEESDDIILDPKEYPDFDVIMVDIEFLLFGKDYSSCSKAKIDLDINDAYIRYDDGSVFSLKDRLAGSYSEVCRGDSADFRIYCTSDTFSTDLLADGTLVLDATVTNLEELYDFAYSE